MRYRPQETVSEVYNAGVAEFFSKVPKKDKYNTVIRGQFDYKTIYKAWFRKLGITSQDTYNAHADDKSLSRKIAIRGDIDIDVKWFVKIDNKSYEIYSFYYAYKRNETEINLVEVSSG